MNVVDKLNRLDKLIRESEYLGSLTLIPSPLKLKHNQIEEAKAEIISVVERGNASSYIETDTAWDDIVTEACEAVEEMLDEVQFDYYHGVTSVSELPELRDIIETAILRATVSNARTF
ncbi:hypothetical protein HFO32_22200 [Rhizobium leguminosarum]|uniref:hypothetical protein n=1 Tax=Rhizobium leguminosarum TaxID=384 RepID=UPI001C93FF9D|nr:hypothetical protein [Rhizobium leguminosarum]MBY5684838.1 hypothetical protein [Rhizobium leguminosarum]